MNLHDQKDVFQCMKDFLHLKRNQKNWKFAMSENCVKKWMINVPVKYFPRLSGLPSAPGHVCVRINTHDNNHFRPSVRVLSPPTNADCQQKLDSWLSSIYWNENYSIEVFLEVLIPWVDRVISEDRLLESSFIVEENHLIGRKRQSRDFGSLHDNDNNKSKRSRHEMEKWGSPPRGPFEQANNCPMQTE